jgi:ABC-type multidrug transport system fused ATPase/permease subunit
MQFNFTDPRFIFGVLVVVLIFGTILGVFIERRKKKSQALRNRFGTEYDRAVSVHGSEQKAEAKLADRETRVEKLNIRDLTITERARFLAEWQAVQSRFVDHPKGAVTEADELVSTLLLARGYPVTAFDQRAADVSVDHPVLMEPYRSAHAVAVRNGPVQATTEELRTAMVQYRAIFDELVQEKVLVDHKAAA